MNTIPLFEGEKSWQLEKRPAIIFASGGAFRKCSPRGGDPIAINFLKSGFNVFTLYYALEEDATYMRLLKDASMALWKVRENAERWHIDPEKIAFGGFSAGGTVAAMLGTKWNSTDLGREMEMPYGINKLNALILGYDPLVFDKKGKTLGRQT